MRSPLTIIDQYLAAKPREFPIVRIFELRQHLPQADVPSLDLVLELGRTDGGARRLRMTFLGVVQLRLVQPSLSAFTIDYLEIADVTARQLEGLRYEVKDAEEDALAFSCREIELEIV